MLCQLCNDITLEALHSSYQHMPTFNALKASSEAGICSLCSLLWSAVERGMDQQQPTQDSFMQYPVRLSLDGVLRSFRDKSIKKILSEETLATGVAHRIFQLRGSKAPTTIDIYAAEPSTPTEREVKLSERGRVSLYREPNMDRFWDNPYGGRPVSYYTNSKECFELAMRWIQFCLTEHDCCRRAICPFEWTEDMDNAWSSVSSSDESDDSKSSSSQPPSKRIRLTAGDNSQASQGPSNFTEPPRQNIVTGRGLLNRPIPITRTSKSLPPGVDDGCWKLHLRSDSLKELEEGGSALLRDCNIPLLPTRYICVDNDPPRLCLAEPESRGFYVALSHCWGTSKPLTTTTATLPDRLKGIPMVGVPQTFRDAIVITRELGLEYLWIDSLCILQDSKEDWQRESSKMGTVYSNAFLTISAAASTDSTQGIFKPRSLPSIPPVEIKPRDSDCTSLYVAEFLENVPLQTRQPIDSRAWCLQEIALSPRVLIYGTEMLGWLCDSTTDSEQGGIFDHEEDPCPPLLAPRLHCKIQPNPVKHKVPEFELFAFLEKKENETGLWASIVNEFTRRKLSYESDRLPALSGVVKEIQSLTGDEYLAGLWKKDLRYDLVWRVDTLFGKEDDEWKRPAKYRAPSWSWASIEGPVRLSLRSNLKIPGQDVFGGLELPPRFRLLEAKVDIAGFDPFGEVSGGYLKLFAGLMQVTICEGNWTAESSSSIARPPWEEKRCQERLWSVSDMKGKSIGRCCLDMPNERPWSSATLWWLTLDTYDGILITTAQNQGKFIRVGQVWSLDPSGAPNIPEEEYKEVILV